MNEDQLKQHINKRLEGTPYKVEAHGKALHFKGPELPEARILELSGSDTANEDGAKAIVDALLVLCGKNPEEEESATEPVPGEGAVDPDDEDEEEDDSDEEEEEEEEEEA